MLGQGAGCSCIQWGEAISRTRDEEGELQKPPSLPNAALSLPWFVTERGVVSVWRDPRLLLLPWCFSVSSCDPAVSDAGAASPAVLQTRQHLAGSTITVSVRSGIYLHEIYLLLL